MDTLPVFVSSNILKRNGRVILPNLQCVQDSIVSYQKLLALSYNIEFLSDVNLNPLFVATETVEEKLLRCPDILTNETQMKPLLEFSSYPFYILTNSVNRVSTPTKYGREKSVMVPKTMPEPRKRKDIPDTTNNLVDKFTGKRKLEF
jgi:hypothetical protein